MFILFFMQKRILRAVPDLVVGSLVCSRYICRAVLGRSIAPPPKKKKVWTGGAHAAREEMKLPFVQLLAVLLLLWRCVAAESHTSLYYLAYRCAARTTINIVTGVQ